MKLSICTDVIGNLSFTYILDKCLALGVEERLQQQVFAA